MLGIRPFLQTVRKGFGLKKLTVLVYPAVAQPLPPAQRALK
jgi:hypothetical protein